MIKQYYSYKINKLLEVPEYAEMQNNNVLTSLCIKVDYIEDHVSYSVKPK